MSSFDLSNINQSIQDFKVDESNYTLSLGVFKSTGTALCPLDMRAFVVPTYKGYEDVYRSPIDIITRTKDVIGATQFTGADVARLIGNSYLLSLAGISCSSHRDKFPVVHLGRTNPTAFTKSYRTVAGSMIFLMEDRGSPLNTLLTESYRKEKLHPDEFPPFDLYLTFVTETGSWATTVIQGIEILDEGYVVELESAGQGIPVSYSFMAISRSPVIPGYFNVFGDEKYYAENKAVVGTTSK